MITVPGQRLRKRAYQAQSSDMGGHEQRRQEHTVCEEQDLCA